MLPISEVYYKFLKEKADYFDPRLSKIIDNLIVFSDYLARNNVFLIKIEPSETYNLNERISTSIPDGRLKRHSQARLVLSINYPADHGLVNVGTCGLIYNRKTNSIIIDYIQGQKEVKVSNQRAKRFREDLLRTIISCTYDEVKGNLFYPEIVNKHKLKELEKPVNYLRDRFFDKDGKLNLQKKRVEDAIKNKLTLQFNDFPNLRVESSKPSIRPKNPRRRL